MITVGASITEAQRFELSQSIDLVISLENLVGNRVATILAPRNANERWEVRVRCSHIGGSGQTFREAAKDAERNLELDIQRSMS